MPYHKQHSLQQKLIELYVYGSFHIALCAVSLGYFGFNGKISDEARYYLIFLGASTLCIYSLHRLIGINKSRKFQNLGRFAVISTYKNHIAFYLLISSIVCIYALWQIKSIVWFICIPSLISLFYVVPIGSKRLRDLPFIKIFLIAFTWTWLCIITPMYINNETLLFMLLSAILGVLYFIGITLPFDIRDHHIENTLDIKTLVSYFGVEKSWLVSQNIFFFSIVFATIALILGWMPLLAGIIWIVVNIISISLVRIHKRFTNDLYYSLILDGCILLFGICYFIGLTLM